MNSTQKRIVLTLAIVTTLIFAAVVIASLGGTGDEPVTATDTTTSTTTTTTTTQPTTTTSITTPTTTSSTTTSASTTTTSTSTTTTAAPTLVLEGNGLGVITFGTEADSAVATIIASLGPPDEDSGWIPSFSGFGTCPGEQVRGLRWATLWTLMTDGETGWRSDGVPHFFAYLNSVFFDDSQSLGLLTPGGIGLGDPVEKLKVAYGDQVQIRYDELIEGFLYTIEVPVPGRLGGGLTGDQNEDLITSIDGGVGCGG